MPSAPEAQGIQQAPPYGTMEQGWIRRPVSRSVRTNYDNLVFQHVFSVRHAVAPAMAAMVHIRRIQTVSKQDITPVKHLCALLKERSIVAMTLQRATDNDIGQYFVAASVAEHLLHRAVGDPTTDGDAWVEE